MSRKIPDWGFNSSFSITSTPVADRGFMPASILTGCILHQWIAFIEIHQIWSLLGSSLDFWRFISHPLCHPGPCSVADSGIMIVFQLGLIQHRWDSVLYCSSLARGWGGRITPLVWHFWQANLNSGWSWPQEESLCTGQGKSGRARLVPVPSKSSQHEDKKFLAALIWV